MSTPFDPFALRSMLFVPALAARAAERAHERGADALVVDLEDAIAPARKADARSAAPAMCAAFAAHGLPVLLRINAPPELRDADLSVCAAAPVACLMLPKVESAATVRSVRARLDTLGVGRGVMLAPLIETPLGLLQADAIAQADASVVALGFGAGDLSVEVGVEPSPALCEPAAWRVAMVAHAYGLACWGVAGSIGDVSDLDGLRAAARRARAFGFTGTPVVHPSQVPIAREVFGVDEAELAYARRVLAAWEAMSARGDGVALLDGRLVEAPAVRRAQRTLARAALVAPAAVGRARRGS